jgi:hypothetical protein
MSDNKIPISRLSRFFDQTDMDLELQMGSEYVEGDEGFKFVLFRVDRTASIDDIYGESTKDGIKYLSPVEFFARIKVENPQNKDVKDGIIQYTQPGNMTLSIYKHHLAELGVEIHYGDYIGYVESEERIRYYTVSNDGRVTSDNAHTIGGFKSFYRTIICTPVQESEFRGI